ncbi:MAG TPA: chromate transporter [Alphaproteobacteria bacterium]|nr:chromate transporter [Alphaproteobacteria bacterium]
MPGSDASAPSLPKAAKRVGRMELFLGFLKIGVLGFGGVAPWARRVIVEERAWLSEEEYASLLGVGQILPGPNTLNLAVMVGDRFQRALGALIAVAALMTMPLAILMAVASLYERFAAFPEVASAMSGTAAAAAGLVIGTALKMTRRLRPTRMAILFGLVAFVAIGVLRFPLIAVVAVLAPISIAAAALERRA